MVKKLLVLESRRLVDIYCFIENSIEECILEIELMNFPLVNNCKNENDTHSGRFNNAYRLACDAENRAVYDLIRFPVGRSLYSKPGSPTVSPCPVVAYLLLVLQSTSQILHRDCGRSKDYPHLCWPFPHRPLYCFQRRREVLVLSWATFMGRMKPRQASTSPPPKLSVGRM